VIIAVISDMNIKPLSKKEIEQILEWDRRFLLPVFSRGQDYTPTLLVGGKDCYVWDADGRRYLDFFSQTWNVNIGHGNQKVIEAIKSQAAELPYVTPSQATRVKSEMAKKLMDLMPENLAQCVFFNSGSEAVEAAFKIAREYTGRYKIISRWYAYHGTTFGSLSALGLPSRRRPHEVLLPGFVFVPPPHCFRCRFGLQYPDCKIRCVEFIEDTIRFEDSERVAAVIAEPIIGTGGVMVPPPEYWPRLRAITKKYGVLLIADEVITGFGRTGKWFGVQHWDVTPDIMTLAKGISSGYLPVSATVVSQDIAQYYQSNPWTHFHTYQGHPLCLAAALANITVMEEENLVEHAAKMGAYLNEKLKTLEDAHQSVGEARGLGLLAAIELVKNKETKEPFVEEDLFLDWTRYAPEDLVADVIAKKAFKKGLIVSGFKFANTIRIAPPLCITEDEIDHGIKILDEVLDDADKMCRGS
jgi:taurine--2-oxoglutarate transaminase